MRITDYLNKECIKIPLSKTTKKEIIEELLELILSVNPEIDKEKAFHCLIEREKVETTAIGDYVAIPHARIKNLAKIYLAFGLSENGIDCHSIDGECVKLFFLILFPEEEINAQLKFLARISRLLKDKNLRTKLFKCKDHEKVIDAFKQYEEHHFQ